MALSSPITPAQFAEPSRPPSFRKQDFIQLSTAATSRTSTRVVTNFPDRILAKSARLLEVDTLGFSFFQPVRVDVGSIYSCPFLQENEGCRAAYTAPGACDRVNLPSEMHDDGTADVARFYLRYFPLYNGAPLFLLAGRYDAEMICGRVNYA